MSVSKIIIIFVNCMKRTVSIFLALLAALTVNARSTSCNPDWHTGHFLDTGEMALAYTDHPVSFRLAAGYRITF